MNNPKRLYLVQDGILNVGWNRINGEFTRGSDFYLITYTFTSNEGYIERKNKNIWRLYTQIGQKYEGTRYYHFDSFKECVEKLKTLKGNDDIAICQTIT